MEQQWQVQRSFPRSITHKSRAERPDPELARVTHTHTHTHSLGPSITARPRRANRGEKHPCDRQCRIFPSAMKHKWSNDRAFLISLHLIILITTALEMHVNHCDEFNTFLHYKRDITCGLHFIIVIIHFSTDCRVRIGLVACN